MQGLTPLALFVVIASACVVVVGACQRLGPTTVRAGMPAYNMAINETGHELLLLNFVRMRYSESPYFMEVSNVFAAPRYTAEANASGTFSSNLGDAANVGGELAYSEAPVIVYTPIGGEQFSRRILQPVGVETIGLLYQGGWSFDSILRLCIQRINDVWNAESATGPTPVGPPEYAAFQRVARTLHWLATHNLLDVIAEVRKDGGDADGAGITSRNHLAA